MTIDAATVDARGMRCPWPVLRAARAMRDHAAVLVMADDPIAPGELRALAEARGWSFEKVGVEPIPSFRLAAKNQVITGV